MNKLKTDYHVSVSQLAPCCFYAPGSFPSLVILPLPSYFFPSSYFSTSTQLKHPLFQEVLADPPWPHSILPLSAPVSPCVHLLWCSLLLCDGLFTCLHFNPSRHTHWELPLMGAVSLTSVPLLDVHHGAWIINLNKWMIEWLYSWIALFFSQDSLDLLAWSQICPLLPFPRHLL